LQREAQDALCPATSCSNCDSLPHSRKTKMLACMTYVIEDDWPVRYRLKIPWKFEFSFIISAVGVINNAVTEILLETVALSNLSLVMYFSQPVFREVNHGFWL
jgi:hypothetical protein